MLRDQRGFNLTNILVAGGITLGIIFLYRVHLSRQQSNESLARVETARNAIEQRFLAIMRSEIAWQNIMNSPQNENLACLRNHTNCLGRAGPFSLFDSLRHEVFDPANPVNGLTFDGSNCSTFTENGNDFCPFRVELKWVPVCGDECEDPPSVTLLGVIRFKPDPHGPYGELRVKDLEMKVTRETRLGDARTCYDLLQRGRAHSGVYSIKPDPNGAAINVYCDQEKDGGGWALILAVSPAGTSVVPESLIVTPDTTGRLPAARVKAYLDASNFQNANNLRLLLPDIDGGLTIAASTDGDIDAESYTAQTPTECRKVGATPVPAAHHEGKNLTLYFSGHGEFGFDESGTAAEGFHGFTACVGKSDSGRDCGKGCGTGFTGQVFRQRGSLWIR
jgi:hypothetical protein